MGESVYVVWEADTENHFLGFIVAVADEVEAKKAKRETKELRLKNGETTIIMIDEVPYG